MKYVFSTQHFWLYHSKITFWTQIGLKLDSFYIRICHHSNIRLFVEIHGKKNYMEDLKLNKECSIGFHSEQFSKTYLHY